jgi:RsiW-degrading membrane proteinase PrsW (M82 family)
VHGVLLGPFVAAPIIEESLKPSGLYLLLAKWPQALSGRFHTALLSALAGLVFGLIENVIYLSLYFPEHTHQLVIVRYTGGLALHTVASFIVGLGINQKLIAAAKGEIPMFAANKRFFVTAIGLHSAYNIAVVVFFRNLR